VGPAIVLFPSIFRKSDWDRDDLGVDDDSDRSAGRGVNADCTERRGEGSWAESCAECL